ncbi:MULTISPECIES: hypothetical protein [Streptomyces]|uniref:Integral membrane protein n=1 Tax=Streptomyces hydrogenans TaxID=1873719 RepID=A0ABQ3PBQ1_9ACTN|nr:MULTISPECIES: hypothetical protein [Streptomyces]MCM1947346.1 hypothetical protein [Streptomyces sp. G2]GHG05435.1 hypothetical protein GCM10018784_17170 [Streptomyces hydrogenans]GHI22430.1 hypothetical protein Shyd_38010 [Streptomyces hydrogenans]
MSGSTKAMTIVTCAVLVLITAYTVALGSSGWLWFGWIVLGVATIGMAAADSTEALTTPRRPRAGGTGPTPR